MLRNPSGQVADINKHTKAQEAANAAKEKAHALARESLKVNAELREAKKQEHRKSHPCP